MFLIGGPAYSGTTLLAHLLNQGKMICLDEPDFERPKQSHRGIPFLRKLFPEKKFPDRPEHELSFEEAEQLIRNCEEVIAPYQLGIKTCNWFFIEYAKVYKQRGYPVIAIVRDIRDALVTPTPDWVGGEEGLNMRYRLIWKNRDLFDMYLRYEELVQNPQETMKKVSEVLGYPFREKTRWDPGSVHSHMVKSARHELLRSGGISKDRVGIWRTSQKPFSSESHHTAAMMGY